MKIATEIDTALPTLRQGVSRSNLITFDILEPNEGREMNGKGYVSTDSANVCTT